MEEFSMTIGSAIIYGLLISGTWVLTLGMIYAAAHWMASRKFKKFCKSLEDDSPD